MRVLVIGGMHGNEPLGIEVVSLFAKNKTKNIDAIFANELAIAANKRFTGSDLNRSFPGEKTSNNYEQKRASELIELVKGYDVVLDFHNTNCPNNDCSFVGEGAKKLLYNTSSWLGLNRVIVADYDCLNKYASNCISIEISLNSELNNAEYWRKMIIELSRLKSINKKQELATYRFVYRMTLEDKERLNLSERSLQAFEPLSPDIADALGVAKPAYPIFIDDAYTPYNYGGLLNKIDV